MALGIILLTISLAINSALHFVQRKGALPANR
jgi:ABC-type tungstate transport system substrate-binding protein